jgi:hypothetical protein
VSELTSDEIRQLRREAFKQGWDAAKENWFPVKELIRMWSKVESIMESQSATEEDVRTYLEGFHWEVFTVIAPYMKEGGA